MGVRKRQLFNIFCLLIVIGCVNTEDEKSPWKWDCENYRCVKSLRDPASKEPALSLEACKMFCNEYGLLWPRPTGETNLGNFLSKININNIDIQIPKRGRSDSLLDEAGQRFRQIVSLAVPTGMSAKASGKALTIFIVNENPDIKEFSMDMDESYSLRISSMSNERVNATITGNTFFGVRHGLETMSQLIVYDDIRDHLLIVRDVLISDKPAYPYRGILLDTSRNYIDVDIIKSTIDASAAVKLNAFHWHITDSHSFPFVMESRPNFSRLGAYSPSKVYTKKMIKEIVEYGLVRGVRVIPEFDAPAHVGEGWQDTDLTVCFKSEPWSSFCVEPPCGQLNPTKEELYEVLYDIYKEMAEVFKTTDVFHMGGDEVSEACWNSSAQVRDFMLQNRWHVDKASYLKLWNYFQTKAQDKAYKAFGRRLPLILWTSTLTDYSHIENFLDKDDYIIQVWTTGSDPQISNLLKKGYRLILSNYDALYFDCGYGAWVGTGNNWCSPYIGWQKVYDNRPKDMAREYSHLVLGGEAALWTEQADSASVEGRLWPRAAALAERLWADPDTDWSQAEHRMLHIRERLVRMGYKAESLEPAWCYQNEGYCHH